MQKLYDFKPTTILLPCPFCSYLPEASQVGNRVRIHCPSCFCSQGIYPVEMAYEKWNRRPNE